MITISQGLALAMLVDGGLGRLMTRGAIYVYSAPRPLLANSNIPAGATLLGIVTTQGKTFYPGSDTENAGLELRFDTAGLLREFGQWVLTVYKSGTPTWFRWKWAEYDDNGNSTYYPRIDGSVGFGLDYDFNIQKEELIAGEKIVIPNAMIMLREWTV